MKSASQLPTFARIGMALALALCLATMAYADSQRQQEAVSALQRGDDSTAARLLEAEVAEFSGSPRERTPSALAVMNDLASTYLRLGRYTESLALNERVVGLYTEVLGARHPATLTSLNGLAATYGSMGRQAESLALFERVLKLRTEILGERHPDTLMSMSNLALSYGRQGRLTEQLTLNERLLGLFTEVFGEKHQHTLLLMNNLAVTYFDLGRYVESLVLIEKVLKLRTETLGERHPDTLVSMSNLGAIYTAIGRLPEELALNEKVLKLNTETLGERHPQTLQSMRNLAGTYGGLGRLAEELALNERVLKLRTQVLGEMHPDTLVSMGNLAASYHALGRYAESLALNEKVLKLRTETLGEKHPATLDSMNNLASSYAAMDRLPEELALIEKVLKLRTETLGERHADTLISMGNLAASYHALGRYAESLALNEKVLRLRMETLGERHPDTLGSMSNVASGYRDLGRLANSLILSERVLRLRAEVLGNRHPDTLRSMTRLAYSYRRAGRPADAASLSAPFVLGAEWQRSQPGLSVANRQSVFQRYAIGYRFFSAVHGSLNQVDEGFRLAELGKGRTLLESMAAQQGDRSGALPTAEQAGVEDLNRQIAAHSQMIAQAPSAEARQNLETARNDLARRYEALISRLKTQYPKYAQLSDPHIVGPRDIPGLIPPNTLAVSYVVDGEEISAWLVDAEGKPRFVDLGRIANLPDVVDALRLANSYPGGLTQMRAVEGRTAWRLADGSYELRHNDAASPKDASVVRDVAEIATFLSERLLQPLGQDLRAKVQWIISPDGALAQLPFDLLSLDGKRVLGMRQLHYTQSLSIYALARARQREYSLLRRVQDLLAVGNPEYQPSADSGRSRRARQGGVVVAREIQLSDTRGMWEALPGTEAEVMALRQIFIGSDALLKAEASEARLQELNAKGALKNYRFLHFATHGFLSRAEPALSSVVLSQVGTREGTDGFITAAEWPGYDLRSDLTVLSACETGLGKSVSGEGVMGLPFALFVAGSVNTILSLWPVDDEATALFMQTFYSKLKRGQSAAQALTETKREFTKQARFSHPAFWAAFVLVGAG